MLIDIQPRLSDCRAHTDHGWAPMPEETRRLVMTILDAEYIEEQDSRRTQGWMWQGTVILVGLMIVITLAGIARIGHVDTDAQALPRIDLKMNGPATPETEE